jgi:hypothetical protein
LLVKSIFVLGVNLLYFFIDSPSQLTKEDLVKIFVEAGIEVSEHDKIRDFLIYHGVLGLQIGDDAQYIFDVGYDPKPMQIRAKRAGNNVRFIINPAFTPALEIRDLVIDNQANLAIY